MSSAVCWRSRARVAIGYLLKHGPVSWREGTQAHPRVLRMRSQKPSSIGEGAPAAVCQASPLLMRGRSRVPFLGRGGLHRVILRQADEFLDTPPELRDTLGVDVEPAGVFQ